MTRYQWVAARKAEGFPITVAGAMLDRLLHRCVPITIDGDSYHMRTHQARTPTNHPR